MLGLVLPLACLIVVPVARSADDPLSAAPLELGEAPVLSAGALAYRPGRGLRVGETGLVIGGFTNLTAQHEEEAGAEVALDTLNFFLIFDRVPRLRTVAELQLKDLLVADEQHAGAHDFAFDVRRLFGDLAVTNELRLRAGTFLTPVGHWNLLLAPPLTWTTEAPLIVEETFFEQTTTGLMVHGSTGVAAGQLGYAVFSQLLAPLEDDPDLEPPEHTAGLRLEYAPGPAWAVGATYQAAEPGAAGSHLGGLHLRWQARRGEVVGEWLYQDGAGLRSAQWGTYLQGVLEVRPPFSLVGRYEHFAPPAPAPPLHLFTVGGVYKPVPFVALKAEYRFVDRTPAGDDPQGFFASFTTLF